MLQSISIQSLTISIMLLVVCLFFLFYYLRKRKFSSQLPVATVIDKRLHSKVSYCGVTMTPQTKLNSYDEHYITFKIAEGEHIELRVDSEVYHRIALEASGYLNYHGIRFIEFVDID